MRNSPTFMASGFPLSGADDDMPSFFRDRLSGVFRTPGEGFEAVDFEPEVHFLEEEESVGLLFGETVMLSVVEELADQVMHGAGLFGHVHTSVRGSLHGSPFGFELSHAMRGIAADHRSRVPEFEDEEAIIFQDITEAVEDLSQSFIGADVTDGVEEAGDDIEGLGGEIEISEVPFEE